METFLESRSPRANPRAFRVKSGREGRPSEDYNSADTNYLLPGKAKSPKQVISHIRKCLMRLDLDFNKLRSHWIIQYKLNDTPDARGTQSYD